MAMPFNTYASGSLRSSSPREPQRIELSEQAGRYFFHFCLTDQLPLARCIIMGRAEGYEQKELDETLKRVKSTKKMKIYMGPILKFLPWLVGGVTIPILGPGSAFLAGSLAAFCANSVNANPKNDYQFWRSMSHAVNPNLVNNLSIKILEGKSIVDFSYYLEDLLWTIDHCRQVKSARTGRSNKKCRGQRPSIKRFK
jgi:hypothetical protein